MNRLLALLILVLIFSPGCRKSTNNPVWERSYGTGIAMFVKATADSGLFGCGEMGGKPYLIKIDRNKNKISDYKYNVDGLFSSAWLNSDLTIVAGSTKGKMLITCFNNQDSLLWDTTFSSSYYINYSSVCFLGNGELMVVGSAKPDSLIIGATGLLFVWLNTTGTIIDKKEIKESAFISANKVVTDNSGNIYLALTRRFTGSKSKATVAKYNNQLQKTWETELYNNPSYGASSLGIWLDISGNIYLSGKTELAISTGSADNSFAASLTNGGSIIWKKYLEDTNSGSSLMVDEPGRVLILNYNCFIINILSSNDGSATGTIRTFNVCDSKNTDAFAQDLDINYDGNIIVAGTNSGEFYIGIKPFILQQQ